jgi:hypothetical protein
MLPAALQCLKRRGALAGPRNAQLLGLSSCGVSSTAASDAESSRRQSSAGASTSGYDQYSWANHTNSRFSIKPSPLSPLLGAHRENKESIKKQEYVRRLIEAHKLLSTQYLRNEGESADEAAEQRIKQLVLCTKALAVLTKYTTAPVYEDRDKMYGYYAMLDKLAASHDKDFQDFSKVLTGSGDVWEYWIRSFQERYAGLPSLEPLEDIYQKPDPEAEAARWAAPAVAPAAAQLPPAAGAAAGPARRCSRPGGVAGGRRGLCFARAILQRPGACCSRLAAGAAHLGPPTRPPAARHPPLQAAQGGAAAGAGGAGRAAAAGADAGRARARARRGPPQDQHCRGVDLAGRGPRAGQPAPCG